MKKTGMGLIIFLLCWVPLIGQAEVEHLVFQKANELYLSGDYSAARDEYKKIVSSGFESVELYYNLGNTFYKLGQIPAAILYLEKALKLDPRDADIRFNLNQANQLVVDKIIPLNEFFLKRWIRSLAGLMKADAWGLISLASFILLLSLIVLAYIDRGLRYRAALVSAAASVTLLLALALVLGGIRYKQEAHPDSAIVFTSSLTAKSSPDPGGTDLFVIHEGLKVRITDQVGAWIRIRLADGNEAWIPETSVEKI